MDTDMDVDHEYEIHYGQGSGSGQGLGYEIQNGYEYNYDPTSGSNMNGSGNGNINVIDARADENTNASGADIRHRTPTRSRTRQPYSYPANPNANANAHAYAHPHAQISSRSNAHGQGYYSYAHPYVQTNPYAHANNGRANANANAHDHDYGQNMHSQSFQEYGNGNGNGHQHSYAHAQMYSPYQQPPCNVNMQPVPRIAIAGIGGNPNGNGNAVIRLIESEMYLEARQRCFTHPEECQPEPLNTKTNACTNTINHKDAETDADVGTNTNAKNGIDSLPLYQYTALGIACRKFSIKTCSNVNIHASPSPWSRNSPGPMSMNTNMNMMSPTMNMNVNMNSPNLKRYNTSHTSSQQIELIRALYRAHPYQVRCAQIKIGKTPLLDCMMNPNCTFELRRFVMDADCYLGDVDGDADGDGDDIDHAAMCIGGGGTRTRTGATTMAMRQLDSNGFLPLHHLINQVRRNAVIATKIEGASSANDTYKSSVDIRTDIDTDGNASDEGYECNALKSIQYMIYKCPNLLNDFVDDSTEISASSASTSTSTPASSSSSTTRTSKSSISPLIHLLSQKIGSATAATNQTNRSTFMKPIVQCAQIMLEANPALIQTKSIMSKCSPLHMALRNGYGDCDSLIELLLRYDPLGYQVQALNVFGDLPVHVAATVGVGVDTWRVLLDHILQVVHRSTCTVSRGSRGGDVMDPIHGPCSCIWSMNKKGLTPLHLMWMRKVNGDQVKYPNSSRQMGQLERDGFYNDALETAIREIIDRKSDMNMDREIDGSGNALSYPEIAREILGPFWDNMVVFLRGTQSIVSTSSYANKEREMGINGDRPLDQGFRFVHAIYALSSPLLPRLFLDLALAVYPNQVSQLDRHGRVPLHYACSSHAIFKKGRLQIPESNDGWKEIRHLNNNNDVQFQLNTQNKTSIVKALIDLNPTAVGVVDRSGFLPLAYAIANEKVWLRLMKTKRFRDWFDQRWVGHCVVDHTASIKELVNVYPDALEWKNAMDSFEWFMVAAAGDSSNLDTVYYLLRQNPIVLTTNIVRTASKKRKFIDS